MNRYLIVIFFIIAVIAFFGCSQKRIAQVSESSQIIDSKDSKKTETGLVDSQKEGIKAEVDREIVTEKELAKVQPADTVSTEKELPIKIKDIYFDFDQYDIREDAKPILKELAAILLKDNKIKVVIEGHCDERGTNEYNLALGEKRANAVKEYLITLGVPSKRINTVSYGEEKPLCTEHTEDCWAKNRRASFVLLEVRR
jgi:peptidoglycan-associated lipoprotein